MDRYFPQIELPITIEQFHTLPKNAAYKYEYFDGRAVLTARPKAFNCVRDTTPFEPEDEVNIAPLPAGEIMTMVDLFRRAHHRTQPFESLPAEAAKAAAHAVLEKTATGKDGPIIEAACFQASSRRDDKRPAGAIIITLAHESALTDPFGGEWREPPPAEAVARRLGAPHLTWVFVDSWEARRGIGTALLAASVRVLNEMGFPQVASTFLLDNGPSTLWHWRNGFRLLPQMSAMRREIRAEKAAAATPSAGTIS